MSYIIIRLNLIKMIVAGSTWPFVVKGRAASTEIQITCGNKSTWNQITPWVRACLWLSYADRDFIGRELEHVLGIPWDRFRCAKSMPVCNTNLDRRIESWGEEWDEQGDTAPTPSGSAGGGPHIPACYPWWPWLRAVCILAAALSWQGINR
jgi:hypothetical protein